MTRFCAATAPALLLAYGVLRWLDGMDGHRGPGVFWTLGHAAFLLAIVLFATLAVRLRTLVRDPYGTAAAGATLIGAACFGWVIVGDLSRPFHDALPLPDPLQAAGPLLFTLGLLALMILLVSVRRVPAWAPLPMLAGFVALSADLDLLPVGAVLIGLGLLPLYAESYRHPVTAAR